MQRLRIEPEQGPGRVLDVRHGPAEMREAFHAKLTAEIEYCAFGRCPICLAPSPTNREHVPQAAIGGKVRTLTCATCNNMLGTRVEGELTTWCFDALPNVRAEGPGAQGLRRIPRIMVRSTDDGQFVLFLDARTDPAVRDMLMNGRISVHVRLPDPNRYRLAALKHAYLAACCYLRRIPDSDVATIIRADLKAARDAGRNADVPHSALAAGLGLMRSYDGPTGPPLALAAVNSRDHSDAGEVWISLAGCMLVQWPLPDISPRST